MMSNTFLQRLARQERKKARPKKRRTIIVDENDPLNYPNPTPEELADPNVRIVICEYVDHWPPT